MVVAHSVGTTLSFGFKYAYLRFEISVQQNLSKLTLVHFQEIYLRMYSSLYMEKSHMRLNM